MMDEPQTFDLDFDCPVCGNPIRSLYNIATDDEHREIRRAKYEACLASHGKNIAHGFDQMLRSTPDR